MKVPFLSSSTCVRITLTISSVSAPPVDRWTCSNGSPSRLLLTLVFPSRGRVREYHYVLKMTSRHFQHVLFFMIDTLSTCCFDDTFSMCCFADSFDTNSCHFSARSHLIGSPDYIFSTKPFDWNSFSTDTSDWRAVL